MPVTESAAAPTTEQRLGLLEETTEALSDRIWRQSDEIDARQRRTLYLAAAFVYGLVIGILIAGSRQRG